MRGALQSGGRVQIRVYAARPQANSMSSRAAQGQLGRSPQPGDRVDGSAADACVFPQSTRQVVRVVVRVVAYAK